MKYKVIMAVEVEANDEEEARRRGWYDIYWDLELTGYMAIQDPEDYEIRSTTTVEKLS